MACIPRCCALLVVSSLLLSLCWATEENVGSGDEPSEESSKCEEHKYVDSQVRVASFNIEEVKTPLLFSCFIILVILAKMGE